MPIALRDILNKKIKHHRKDEILAPASVRLRKVTKPKHNVQSQTGDEPVEQLPTEQLTRSPSEQHSIAYHLRLKARKTIY
ncbi:hypothetical protein P4S68_21235 [Pseudoalteromonas sp. Hal099]